MNNIPFVDQTRFPLDATTLNNLQNISIDELQKAVVALLGTAGSCILSGVALSGTAYGSGIVVHNGEILKFAESQGDYLTVNQTVQSVTTDEGTFDVLNTRTAAATPTATDTPMSSLKRVNLAQYQNIVQGVNSYKVLDVDNEFMSSRSSLLYENTPAGISTIRGGLTLKAVHLGGGDWQTLYDFANGADRYKALIPRFPLTSASAIYFNGTYLSEPYNEPRNDVFFRLTRQGLLQVWVPNMTEDLAVFIDVIYYNPQ
jgi:hypothetical protein